MIGIQLDGEEGQFLDTSLDTTINIQLENPIFSEDKLSQGSFSLPFNLPGGESSPRNSELLKNPDVLENNQAFQPKHATLFFDKNPFKKGQLKPKTMAGNTISAHFIFGMSTIDPRLKTAKLREVVDESIVISNTPITKTVYIKKLVDPENDWNITVNGVNYSGGFTSVITAINDDGVLSKNTGKHVPHAARENSANSPKGFLSPSYLVLKLVTWTEFFDSVTGMWFTISNPSTDPLQELSITTSDPDSYLIEGFDMDPYYDGFDAFLANYPSHKLVFPVCFNANPYGGKEAIKNSELVNGVNASGVVRNVGVGLNTKTLNINSLQPFVRLKFVLDKIASTFGFQWEGDFYDHADLPGFLIDNSCGLDVPQAYIEGDIFVFWRRSFNVSELVPDLSVIEFLAGLKSRYNLAIYPIEDTTRVKICFREEIAKRSAFRDVTDYASKIDAIDDIRVTGYKITVPREEEDAFSVPEILNIGEPQKDITIGCGRLHQTATAVISGASVRGVRVSREFGADFGLRVFHYTGPTNNGVFTYHACDINSDSIYEPLNSFILNIGIYDRFWAYWLMFEQNRRSVKLKVNYPFRELKDFDWELRQRFDRSDFLLKGIGLSFTRSGFKVTSTELYTMR